MRITVDLPDKLLSRAKKYAALSDISLKDFFIEAIEQRLTPRNQKTHRPPPVIGSATSRRIRVLKPEQIDRTMFG